MATSKRTSKGRRPSKPKPTKPRPTMDLGHQVRVMRLAAGLTHEVLADRTGMRAPQISLLETGHNVESHWYAVIARALGYRGALELFHATDGDPLRKQRDRAWRLLDESQKKRALKWIKVNLLVED